MINITHLSHLGDYRLQITFDDGKQVTVDFRPFLTRAVHPDIRAYLEQDKFKSYHIEHGELVWGEYDLCFPMMDLYENHILHDANIAKAV